MFSSIDRCAGAYESVGAAIVIWDHDGALWYANGAALRLWALPLDHLRGRAVCDLLDIPLVAAGPLEPAAMSALLGAYEGAAYVVRAAGERVAVRVRSTAMAGRRSDAPWLMSTLLEMPAEVSDGGEPLLERDLLQTLMDSAPDQVYIKDRNSRFTFANYAQAAYFGVRDPADLLGKTDFDFFSPQVAQSLFQQEQRMMETGVALIGLVEDQSIHFGRPWWVQSTKVPITRGGAVVGLVGISRNVTDLKLVEEQFAHRALHDPLTGLPNRTLLLDRLEHGLDLARSQSSSFGVCMLDLDHFKAINDVLGHQRGDLALQIAAGRLSATLRQGDTMARLGGDEFAVLLPGASEEGAVNAAERLRNALIEPADLGDCRRLLSVSIGIAVYPDHAANATALLDCADAAMYAAKSSGATCTVYAASLARKNPS
jgi:diguanylate cyclase (GGDEF)-like protein/PAS domain S-box-containing protein